jgi:hypothetical protein
VDDPLAVGGVERARDLGPVAEHGLQGKGPLGHAVRHPLDQLHHEKVSPVLMPDVEEGADVGMVELTDGLGFALEARAKPRVGGEVEWEDLDGDLALETGVSGAPDHPHAAGAQRGHDLIGSNAAAGLDVYAPSDGAGAYPRPAGLRDSAVPCDWSALSVGVILLGCRFVVFLITLYSSAVGP